MEKVLWFEVVRLIGVSWRVVSGVSSVSADLFKGLQREQRTVSLVCLLDNRAPHAPKMIHQGMRGT
jgi:hypothetical protein